MKAFAVKKISSDEIKQEISEMYQKDKGNRWKANVLKRENFLKNSISIYA